MNTREHHDAIEMLRTLRGQGDFERIFKPTLTAQVDQLIAADDYLVGRIVDGKLTCPKCGKQFAEIDDFRHLDDIVEYRTVEEIKGTEVVVEGMCERYDESDGNDRLECRNDSCMVEFALPEGLTFEFV